MPVAAAECILVAQVVFPYGCGGAGEYSGIGFGRRTTVLLMYTLLLGPLTWMPPREASPGSTTPLVLVGRKLSIQSKVWPATRLAWELKKVAIVSPDLISGMATLPEVVLFMTIFKSRQSTPPPCRTPPLTSKVAGVPAVMVQDCK